MLRSLGPAASASTPQDKPVGVKTSNYTLKPWEFAEFDASAASLAATLPANAPVGTKVATKRIDLANVDPANAFTVAVVPSAGDTIRNGLTTNTSVPLTGQDQLRIWLKESTTQWTVCGGTDPVPSNNARYARTLGNQNTIKAGDTLVSGATANVEMAFATTFTIAANTLVVGQRLHFDVAGGYNISLNGTQRPRIRVGPPATAVTARAAAIDFGALNGLLSTVTDAGYAGTADLVVQATGTSGVLRCVSALSFTTGTTGQVTGFLAGPTAGVPGNITIDTTVANVIALTDSFGNTGSANNSTLRLFSLSSYAPPTGSS